jgi:hypothetical protein
MESEGKMILRLEGLSSYGPSVDLLRELCARGRWEDGLEYLVRWQDMWDDPRVHEWIEAARARELPGSKEPRNLMSVWFGRRQS